jgi:hypothetical protein
MMTEKDFIQGIMDSYNYGIISRNEAVKVMAKHYNKDTSWLGTLPIELAWQDMLDEEAREEKRSRNKIKNRFELMDLED